MGRARIFMGTRAEQLLSEAERELLRAASITPNPAFYNLALVCSLQGDEDGCRRWLEKCEELDILPGPEDLIAAANLDNVRGWEWFEALIDRLQRVLVDDKVP